MSDWLKRKTIHIGAVWYPCSEAPGPNTFLPLERYGFAVAPLELPDMNWALDLRHPDWGHGRVASPKEVDTLPSQMTPFRLLSSAEKSAIDGARSRLTVALDAPGANLLRERKHLFRFMAAVGGTKAVAMLEPLSMRLWTPADMADELAHDADLDIEALYSVHTIAGDTGECIWVHTHGLVAAGGFDLDFVQSRPGTDFYLYPDIVRTLAAQALDDPALIEAPSILVARPDIEVRFLPTSEVLAKGRGAGADRLRDLVKDDDGAHIDGHAVACAPAASGVFRRWLGRRSVEVDERLWSGDREGSTVLYPDSLTTLMEERARATYRVLSKLHEEFAGLGLRTGVKLGCPTDDGGREHMWFLVEQLGADSILATLLNEPYSVDGLHEGDRGRHPVELLTDWVIHTPLGAITPRSQVVARMIRERPDDVRAAIAAGWPD